MNFDQVSFGELAQAAGATCVVGDPDLPVTDVQYDSRLIKPGNMFVALRGGYVDGHQFLEDAVRRGASSAILERAPESLPLDNWALVADSRASLSAVASAFFRRPADSFGVIGITGTDGKTTTSYLTDAMLRHNRMRTGLIGTISVRIADEIVEHDTRQTTPESLDLHRHFDQMRAEKIDWAVIEATSHALVLPRLDHCPIDIAVVTNVTREHLDFHGSIDSYRNAKANLLRRLGARGDRNFNSGAVINADDEGACAISGAAGDARIAWFSTRDPLATIYGHTITTGKRGTGFVLRIGSEESNVHLNLLGSYNVFNALAAAGVGHLLGMTVTEIAAGLEALEHVPGRLQPVDEGQPFGVFVDYAHSPSSLSETLELLRNVTSGRLIAVFGSAGERDRGKRAVQGRISAEMADFSIFTSEDPRFEDPVSIISDISSGARQAGAREGSDFEAIEDRRAAIARAIDLAGPGDMVLLAGKGHERCIIYGDQRTPWDEAAEAREALRKRGFQTLRNDSEGTS